ncbi:MAG: hypothetical protein ACE5HS_03505 [bacterium]
MKITEDKIRQITLEAQRQLGPPVHADMLKKVVKEVVNRLIQESILSTHANADTHNNPSIADIKNSR